MNITKEELYAIKKCLELAELDEVFPEWEFPLLFRISKEEFLKVSRMWPFVDHTDETVKRAINSAMAHMLGYPNDITENTTWNVHFDITISEFRELFERVHNILFPEKNI